jgi:cysteine sulfinate desulfinase/cysteine desulfurase-like protein
MRVPDAYARGTVRFSLGLETTHEDMGRVLQLLPPLIVKLRESTNF